MGKEAALGAPEQLPIASLPPVVEPPPVPKNAQDILPTPTEALAPSSLLGRTAKYGAHLGSAAIRAVMEEQQERAGKLKDRVTVAQNMAARRLGLKMNVSPGDGADKGDEALPDLDGEAAQPPDVLYGSDVVVDMEGYHSRDPSDQTVTGDDDRPQFRDVVDLAVQHT